MKLSLFTTFLASTIPHDIGKPCPRLPVATGISGNQQGETDVQIFFEIFPKIIYPPGVTHSAKLLCHQAIGIEDYSQLPSSLHFYQLRNLQILISEI